MQSGITQTEARLSDFKWSVLPACWRDWPRACSSTAGRTSCQADTSHFLQADGVSVDHRARALEQATQDDEKGSATKIKYIYIGNWGSVSSALIIILCCFSSVEKKKKEKLKGRRKRKRRRRSAYAQTRIRKKNIFVF